MDAALTEGRNTMRRMILIWTCLALIGVGGCTKQQARTGAHEPGTLTVALRQEPTTLDPLLLEGTGAYTFGELLYSYLTNYDAQGHIVGDAAIAAPTTANGGVSADGKRVTFHLRHDLRWQDGTPLTSRDVVFTYHAIMSPANNVSTRFGYDTVASIAAPDPYTVTIALRRPYAPIISDFFGGDSNYPILPAHLLANLPSLNHVPFNGAPVGSGPYRLDRWDRGDRITLRANASYYRGAPRIERLVLPFVPNDSTAMERLQTGEIDAAFNQDASRIAELRSIPHHRVVVTPVPYFYALAFNLHDPVLADHAVREAIALSIDRSTLTRKISGGVYDAATAMRGLFTWAYDPHVAPPPYDPAQAAALLSKDGWVRGPGGIRVKNGQRLSLQLSFPTGADITARFAVAIAAAARAVGIDLTLRGYDRSQYVAHDGPLLGGHYQVSLYDYQGAGDPDPTWLLACDERAPGGFDFAQYCNAQVDSLLRRAAATYDRAERIALYGQVQRRLVADLPYDFICQISEVDVIPDDLGGFARPILSPFNSASSWYWESPKRSGG
jgi:peptide/nickel transport system substrate-binding protein